MEHITINNAPEDTDRLIIPIQQYEMLKMRISTGLLTFFDRIEFGEYREFTNSELIIRGYRKEWVAISTFYISDWYIMSQDEFVTEMESRLKYLKLNYDKIFERKI